MGSSKGIITEVEFFSFWLIQLTRYNAAKNTKHPYWWNGMRKDFRSLNQNKINEIIAFTLKDVENTKTEAELLKAVTEFIAEQDFPV